MNEYMQYLAELIPEKDSLKLVKSEAEKYYKSHSLDDCFSMGINLYQSDNFQIQEVGVFLLGYSAHHNASALSFLRNTVSRHNSWKVQEILAMAFDNHCKIIGYEAALPLIKEWLNSDCANVRRAVSEGLRIWTSRPYFKDNPQMAIQLLSAHKEDNSEYVRKSVGNALRDISKKYPQMISEELNSWDLASKEIKQVYKLASKYMCNVNILHLIEGAKQAKGLTVIIDVFRAFSLECYLYDMDVKQIRPVGTIEEAFSLRSRIQNSILIGERQGKKCDGFDYGNSPSTILKKDVAGKTIIHTTSAGTQGIVNAVHASEIITGSLVNAKAVAEYIIARQPQTVSLVCMGNGGVKPAPEDELCAEYIKSIIEGREFLDLEQKVNSLKYNGGEHFFDKSRQSIFPEADFYMCVKYNKFPFVITIEKDEIGYVASKKNVL